MRQEPLSAFMGHLCMPIDIPMQVNKSCIHLITYSFKMESTKRPILYGCMIFYET
jgi:hypothetical protein